MRLVLHDLFALFLTLLVAVTAFTTIGWLAGLVALSTDPLGDLTRLFAALRS